MSIEFSCGRCGQRLGADSSKAGQVLRCPNCQELVTVPMPVPEPGVQSELQPQPTTPADTIFCMKCGERNSQNNFRCGRCGEVLSRGAVSSTSTERVPNYLVQAILTTLFCCPAFGIPAIVFAAQVNPWNQSGNRGAAMEASRKARMWTWLSFGVGIVWALIWTAVTVVGMMAESNAGRF